jgi:hypothetical protein
VLTRSEYSTLVTMVNPRGTPNDNLKPLSKRLVHVRKFIAVDLATLYIPGVSNNLADKLYRCRPGLDIGDLKFVGTAFENIAELVRVMSGVEFTLDGGANPKM